MLDENQCIVEKVMRDIGLTSAQIALAFEDSPKGKLYMSELCKTYALDAYSICRERMRTHIQTIRDYENEMAIAKSEGKAEGLITIAENMCNNGFTEEQIKLALGDAYVS